MYQTEIAIEAASDATVYADRIRVTGDFSHYLFASGQRVDMRITNSLLHNTMLAVHNTTDTALPGSRFVFAFNTFATNQFYYQLDCRGTRIARSCSSTASWRAANRRMY
jgi:hypothetical protein